MKQAAYSKELVTKLTDIPNVGREVAEDFRIMGILKPQDIKGKTGIGLYKKLCKITNSRHDPCVLDTFMAVVDYVNGAEARGWWRYTKERKRLHPEISRKK